MRLLRLTLIALLAIVWSAAAVPTRTPSEYEVKAAYLYNFARFVEWPDARRDGPLVVGILGGGEFARAATAVFAEKMVRGRRLQIAEYDQPQDLAGCHILFVGHSAQRALGAIFAKVRTQSVLVVGESEDFARRGGIIGFIRRDDKLHFQINIGAAERAGLKISAKLLRLAQVIR